LENYINLEEISVFSQVIVRKKLSLLKEKALGLHQGSDK
jgi:hypothetical protein